MKPLVTLSLAMTHHQTRGFVHCLAIIFLNRSDRVVFIENFYLGLNDETRAVPRLDALSGEFQKKRRIEPGDKYAFHISADDIRQIGRPATDFTCAGVGDAAIGSYETEAKTVQDHIADLLKDK